MEKMRYLLIFYIVLVSCSENKIPIKEVVEKEIVNQVEKEIKQDTLVSDTLDLDNQPIQLKEVTKTENTKVPVDKEESVSALKENSIVEKETKKIPILIEEAPISAVKEIVKVTSNEVTSSKMEDEENKGIINHTDFDDLLKIHVTADGRVNYKGFYKDKTKFEKYLSLLSNNPPQTNWSREEKLVYWINAYNAFTIKLILDNYPVASIKDIGSKLSSPWKINFFKIGGKQFNLNDIEHEILRKMNEPRIHFAIVCASFSCPALRNEAYKVGKLEVQLKEQTIAFLMDQRKNIITSESLKLSKIFDWFKGDFTTEGNLISFIQPYVDVVIKKNASISYLDYNWDLNE